MKPKQVADWRGRMLFRTIERQGVVTRVRLRFEPPNDKSIRALGVTHCSKNDVFSAEVGEAIALGRALKDLGAKIEARGNAACVTKKEYSKVMHMWDSAVSGVMLK
jgi:hypothetical protein